MGTLDVIILICLFLGAAQGLWKGFIVQVIAIISILLGAWMSFHFSSFVADWLNQYLHTSFALVQVIAFILILCGVAWLMTLAGKMLRGLVRIVMLGWLDRLLGLVFGLITSALVIGLVVLIFNTLDTTFHILSSEALAGNDIYTGFKNFSYGVFPYFKDVLFR